MNPLSPGPEPELVSQVGHRGTGCSGVEANDAVLANDAARSTPIEESHVSKSKGDKGVNVLALTESS